MTQALVDHFMKVAAGRGCKMKSFRMCIHEASHAIDAGLEDWSFETIGASQAAMSPAAYTISEAKAVATECIACRMVGVEWQQSRMTRIIENLKLNEEDAKHFWRMVQDMRNHIDLNARALRLIEMEK